MPKVVALHCPHCRAPLPAILPGQTVVHCEYCNHDTNVAHTRHMPAAVDWSRGVQPLPRPAPRTNPVPIVVGVALATVLAGGVGAFSLLAGRPASSLVAAQSAAAPAPKLLWSDSHTPLITDIGGDPNAGEDVVGVYRELSRDASSTLTTYVGAFSGQDFKPVWRSRPLSQQAYTVRFAVVGTSVLIADDTATVLVLDRATGAERYYLKQSDRIDRFCRVDDTHVWLEIVDEQYVTLDLTSGVAARAARPAACPAVAFSACPFWQTADHSQPTHATCLDAVRLRPLAIPDMSVTFAIRNDAGGIAVGNRAKGTRFAMLAGFDPANLAGPARWVRRVNPDAATASETVSTVQGIDAADREFFAVYRAGHENLRAQLADVPTGAIRWDIRLPAYTHGMPPDHFALSFNRVYVALGSTLLVLDAATGGTLGTIGEP